MSRQSANGRASQMLIVGGRGQPRTVPLPLLRASRPGDAAFPSRRRRVNDGRSPGRPNPFRLQSGAGVGALKWTNEVKTDATNGVEARRQIDALLTRGEFKPPHC